MNWIGSVIVEKGSHFKLLCGEEIDWEKVNMIKDKLINMTNYLNDFVIVDFFDEIPNFKKGQSIFEKETVVFFQTIKCNSYKHLNFYEVNIRIDSKNSNKMYERYVRKRELLELFDEICVQKKFPDLSKWKKLYDSTLDGDWSKMPRVVTDEKEDKREKNCDLARMWFVDELQKEDFPIYFDALKYLCEEGWCGEDIYYADVYLEELCKMGIGKDTIEKFKNTVNPIYLDFIGENYLKGRCGVSVDYRKAYRYFYHGEKRGNLSSRYHRALMFKDGLYVKKNYKKYVKMVESIVDDFVGAGGKNNLLFIDFAFVELAKIYKEQNECEKCLKYAYQAKEIDDLRNSMFLEVTKMSDILDIIYSVIPFDKDNMDIYDLLYCLKQPAKAKFFAQGKEYNIESLNLNGYCMVKFHDKYYKNIKEFFNKASIDGEKFDKWLYRVDYVEVV